MVNGPHDEEQEILELRRRRRWRALRSWMEQGNDENELAAVISEEIASIGRKVDAVDDALRSNLGEIQKRVFHTLDVRLQTLELEVARRVAAAHDQLNQQFARANARVSILFSVVLLLLAVLLFRL